METTGRFSDRVADYVRARPGYPDAVHEGLLNGGALLPKALVADIGAGTGLSAELFLRHGHRVIGVEPNAAMREAGLKHLARFGAAFTALGGSAEATGIAATSIDLVIAAQAFHWFQPAATRAEFRRILKPGGQVALIWNDRQTDTSAFLRDYEALLQSHGTDYREVNHRNIDAARLSAFFGAGAYREFVCTYVQQFDYEGLEARLLSSSYTPPAGDPRRQPMLQALCDLHARHALNGQVAMVYDTRVYYGALPSEL
jgi:SAM-dependent methyltransferase